MIVARDAATLRRVLQNHSAPVRGFVPTMGCLHAGHESLIVRARADCATVVVSIFVNPAQFGPNEDYSRYPRTLDADLERCRVLNVDIVFAPETEVLFPGPLATEVRLPGLNRQLCGGSRPGHFDGVALIVTKLLNLVRPDRMYLGQKDAQQVTVLRRLIADLDLGVEVVACPTVREPDGLAMSSRNAYLTAEQRQQATALHRALQAMADAVQAGDRDCRRLIREATALIESAGPCDIDYVAIVDPHSLETLPTVETAALAALAVRIGECRLIDNLTLTAATRSALSEKSTHAT